MAYICHFSYSCDQVADEKQLKEERVYCGWQFGNKSQARQRSHGGKLHCIRIQEAEGVNASVQPIFSFVFAPEKQLREW